MDTIIEKMNQQIDEDGIRRAGDILKNGGLVAFPTETVYGLGANALDEKAAAKIYAAKGRPSDNPLIVHIAELQDLYGIAKVVPERAKRLAAAFWPGPLTMIFRKKDNVPYGTTGGLDTVAVRIPDHKLAVCLIKAGGGYIAAPSANTSGRPSPTQASHVQDDLSGKIDMIIDGGNVGIGLESTIVDMSEDQPVILRPGYISQEMIEQVIGPVNMDRALLSEESSVIPKAPGMKYKHYAPKAALVVIEGTSLAVTDKINELIHEEILRGGQPGIIATDESRAAYRGGLIKSIGTRSDGLSISRNLYRILREFDELEVTKIYSEAFETPMMGEAIMNRLMKAAGHQIIRV